MEGEGDEAGVCMCLHECMFVCIYRAEGCLVACIP